ncbi:dff46e1a-ddca-4790-928d-23b648db52e4 [Sclerotinia trifoliorum]|uniref:Dff46e1a-ddca-4790-928d-23b648db52e4 n=1 Tax=Sclerotinia trifoliorum TaxID=28548 RepID=A0A8H2W1A0_9HELO|nr:dff46e1a-ddca-4790-928d-23b648db52e4 [Sclerotinia trifoliorum]
MFWLSQRSTTRVEDMAYCMLGIFDINMPLLYGEGAKAFVRLQEEIIKVSADHTIFCWSWTDTVPPAWNSLISPSPDTFKHSKYFRPEGAREGVSPYTMTNLGLSIRLPFIQAWTYSFIVLRACGHFLYHNKRVCIPIKGYLRPTSDSVSTYDRLSFPPDPIFCAEDWASPEINMYVGSRENSADRDEPSFPYKFGSRRLLITIAENIPAEPPPGARAHIKYNDRYIPMFHSETYPQGLFDETRSVFTLKRRVGNVQNGLLTLCNEDFRCVIFISCKTSMASEEGWFCHILPLVSLEEDEAERLLESLESQVASMTRQNDIRAAVCPEVRGHFVIDNYSYRSSILPARLELGLGMEKILELSKGIKKSLHV